MQGLLAVTDIFPAAGLSCLPGQGRVLVGADVNTDGIQVGVTLL